MECSRFVQLLRIKIAFKIIKTNVGLLFPVQIIPPQVCGVARVRRFRQPRAGKGDRGEGQLAGGHFGRCYHMFLNKIYDKCVFQAAMRRSQSTGDIDGRGSDDGAAEYIQYIDEGFYSDNDHNDHSFPVHQNYHNQDDNNPQTTVTRKKPHQRLLLLFSCRLYPRRSTAVLR